MTISHNLNVEKQGTLCAKRPERLHTAISAPYEWRLAMKGGKNCRKALTKAAAYGSLSKLSLSGSGQMSERVLNEKSRKKVKLVVDIMKDIW